MKYQHLASYFLRVGLAAVLLYAAVASFLSPMDWIGYFPSFIVTSGYAELALKIHATVEVILALWLLSGKWLFEAAIVAAVAMLAVIVVNIKGLDVVFRDVAIMFSALALAALAKK